MESGFSRGNRAPGRSPFGWASQAPSASRPEKPRHCSPDADRRGGACYHCRRPWRGGLACSGKAGDEAGFQSDDANCVLGLAHCSRISKSWVNAAVFPSMIEAEQYFSAESLIARSTWLKLRLLPVRIKWK